MGDGMIEPTFVDPDAAFDYLKAFVRNDVPGSDGFITDCALRLAGAPPAEVEAGINAIGDEIYATLKLSWSHAKAFSITLATCQLIRERLAEIERNGKGSA